VTRIKVFVYVDNLAACKCLRGVWLFATEGTDSAYAHGPPAMWTRSAWRPHPRPPQVACDACDRVRNCTLMPAVADRSLTSCTLLMRRQTA